MIDRSRSAGLKACSSNSQPLLEMSYAIARDAQLRALLVLQPDEDAAVDAGKQLVHETCVDDRRAMNPHEAARIQLFLELGDGVIHDVIAAVGDGKGQLVFGEKMRHARHFENRRPLADA